MALKKIKPKKIISTSIAVLLLIGIIASVGFLSFTGMLLITPSIIIAGASFFFAVAIEGEVYKQNILNGMQKLLTQDYIRQKIIERELENLLDQKENLKQSKFLHDYYEQKKYLKKLRAHHADKKTIHQEEKRLKYMQTFFCDYIFGNDHSNPLAKELQTILPEQKRLAIQKEISRKKMISKAMWVLYLLAGVSCTFATIFSIHSGFITLMATFGFTIAPTLLLGGIVPIAIMAGIGYALMLYHNVSDIICNDSIQKWTRKIANYFVYKAGSESRLKYVLRVSAVGLVVAVVIGLGIFATVATAGTWWLAAKQGARLLPYIAKFADWIRNITIPAMFIPNLLYNLNNSLSTIKKLSQISIQQQITTLQKEINETINNETTPQLINPFRILIKIIEAPVKILTFLAHLVSICVMSDQLPGVPPTVTAGLNCANEGVIDGHFFIEDSHKNQDHVVDDHKHHDHMEDDHEDHDHDHSTLIDHGLKLVLSPLYFLNALWSYSFQSRANNPKSFIDVMRTTFGIAQTIPVSDKDKPKISNDWKKQEILMKLNKKIAHYDQKNIIFGKSEASQKQAVLRQLHNKVKTSRVVSSTTEQNNLKPLQKVLSEELTSDLEQKPGALILSSHRFFHTKQQKTKSQKFVEELLHNEDYQSLKVNCAQA